MFDNCDRAKVIKSVRSPSDRLICLSSLRAADADLVTISQIDSAHLH
jgi:hypothetical protein